MPVIYSRGALDEIVPCKNVSSRDPLFNYSRQPHAANRSYPIEEIVNEELYDLFRANSLREAGLFLLFGMFDVIHLFSALIHFSAAIRGE